MSHNVFIVAPDTASSRYFSFGIVGRSKNRRWHNGATRATKLQAPSDCAILDSLCALYYP